MVERGCSIRRAMILAAGYGTRLQPLTDHLPKPLIRVRGRPLLGAVIEKLHSAGVDDCIVNAHHLPEAVEDFASGAGDPPRLRITVLREEEILGTGGGLVNAAPLLAGDDFILHNADVLCDLDLATLIAGHRDSDALITLAVIDWSEANTVCCAADGVVTAIGRDHEDASGEGRWLTYTGIAVVTAEFIECLPAKGFSTLVEGLNEAMRRRTGSVRAVVFEDVSWNDLGTPERYRRAEAELAAAGGGGWPEFAWPVASPDDDERPPLPMELLASAGFGDECRIEALAQQGSLRRFSRVRQAGRTGVLMETDAADIEFDSFVDIGRFLADEDLGAPRILGVDPDQRAVLVDDLGDDSLFALATAPGADRERLYRGVIDLLVRLQVHGTARAERCPAAVARVFDGEVLRWETDYFREHFLQRWCGLPQDVTIDLTPEFDELAAAALRQPRVLLHRDFQSQNILCLDGRARIVDFQGLRPGPIAYDLMSLLRDGYVELGDEVRDGLLEYYRAGLAAAGGPEVSALRLRGWCVVAGLQRSMQMLGAFARLTSEVGRAGFVEHIPRAMRHLRALLRESRDVEIDAPSLSRLEAVLDMLPWPGTDD